MKNLAELFSVEEQKKLVQRRLANYRTDIKSRERHMVQLERFQRLYACEPRRQSAPMQSLPEVSSPLLAYTTVQVHSRLFDMLLPSDGIWFRSKPTDEGDIDRAMRTETYADYYLRHKVVEFVGSMDVALWQVVLNGDAYVKAWHDVTKRRLCVNTVGIEDFVLPYGCRNPDPSLRGVPHYTEVQRYTLAQLRRMPDSFTNLDLITKHDGTQDDRSALRQAVDAVAGQDPVQNEDSEDDLRKVLEHHCWIRLPNRPNEHPAFDGGDHPVLMTIDAASEVLLRLEVRERPDYQSAMRYERDVKVYAAQMKMGMQAEPPEAVQKTEICYYTNLPGFPSDGAYHLGFGAFIGPLNLANNEMLRQYIGALALKNSPPAFISRNIQMQRGDLTTMPGKVIEVPVPPGQLDGAIKWMQPPAAEHGFANVIEKIEILANRVGASGEILSGEPTGSNETARGMTIRAEQAMKQIMVLARRQVEALRHLGVKIFEIMAETVDPDEYVKVAREDGTFAEIRVSPEDFRPDSDIQPVADPRIGSRVQELDEANTLAMFAAQNPLMNSDPEVMYAVTQSVLNAMHQPRIAKLVKQPPPAPQPDPEDQMPMDQDEENARFLEGRAHPVHPDDDDGDHLSKMQEFMDDGRMDMLDAEVQKSFQQHFRNHVAQSMRKRRSLAGNNLGVLSAQPGGTGGMEVAPGNPTIPAGAGPA